MIIKIKINQKDNFYQNLKSYHICSNSFKNESFFFILKKNEKQKNNT